MKVTFIEGRLAKTLDAYRRAGVHLLPLGELENHLPGYQGNEYAVTDAEKLKAFELERDMILGAAMTPETIAARYGRLVDILDDVSRPLAVNMDLYLNFVIGDWIHKDQSAVVRGEVTDMESLKKSATVEWVSHARIFDITAFSRCEHGFDCTIKLKPLIDSLEREITFNDKTVAANFCLASHPPGGTTA